MSTTTNTNQYGGYSISHLREAGGEETLRFDAFITYLGKKVLYVYGDGHGGSYRYQPVNERWDLHQQVISDFEAYAAHWNRDGEFAGIEDGDQLVNRLIEVATLNRLRKLPFLLDDMDFWTTGDYHQFASHASREQVVTVLSGSEYADRSPRVWEREAGDFVPVTGIAREVR